MSTPHPLWDAVEAARVKGTHVVGRAKLVSALERGDRYREALAGLVSALRPNIALRDDVAREAFDAACKLLEEGP